MTACKDSLSGKKAVSATLAGVLAVGMVPAAAFAADADQPETGDIELQSTTAAATLFSDGTVSFEQKATPVAGKTNEFTANANADGTALDFGAIEVTPRGESAEPIAGDNYKTTITKDGSEVKEIKAPGTYTVTVEAVDGTYKGGKVSATVTVKGASLAGAAFYQVNPDDATDLTDTTFIYTGNELDLGLKLGNKALEEGTDYTVKIVNKGDDANNDPAVAVKNAGDYYAVVTGQGNFAGNSLVIDNLKVNPFVVTTGGITVDDVTGKTGAKPTVPTSVKSADGKDELANPAEVKLALTNGQTWDAAGTYTFSVSKADDNNKNIEIGTGVTATCNKVDALASFQYDGKDFPSEFTVNNGDGDDAVYFDLSKVTAKDADGNKVTEAKGFGVSVTKKGDTADATADFEAHKAGVYVVTASVDASQNEYALGGSATCTVTIKEATVITDATVVVKEAATGKVVTSVEKEYDGNAVKASDYTVSVKDAKGNEITGTKTKLVDADGNEVTEAVNAGSYELVIENPNVDFQGEAVVPITISKLDLSDIKIGAEVEKKFDTTNNAVVTYVPKNTEVANLLLEYATSEKNADGTPVTKALPQDAKVTVKNAEGEEVTKLEEEGTYTIDITVDEKVAGNYVLPGTIYFTVADAANLKFADNANQEAWYFAEVNKAAAKGYMHGYAGTNLFGPNDNITRGQVAVVLYNMAVASDMAETDTDYDNGGGVKSFDDVDGGMYYAGPVAWAKQAGIVTGYGDGTFRPDDNITREEFATMLARYAEKFSAYAAGTAEDIAGYADASAVDAWATEYVAWAVNGGYMGKNTDVLAPISNLTRAEAAAMVVRYAG